MRPRPASAPQTSASDAVVSAASLVFGRIGLPLKHYILLTEGTFISQSSAIGRVVPPSLDGLGTALHGGDNDSGPQFEVLA